MAKKIYMPTPDEDAVITAAASADPDALPLSDEELASADRFEATVTVELTLAEAQALAQAAEAGEATGSGAKAAFRRADRKLHRAIAAASKAN